MAGRRQSPVPRRALVVGAASGIGRACAESLRSAGWTVVGADRDPAVEDRGYEAAIVCDVRDTSAVDMAVEAAGEEPLGFVLYAAGAARPSPLREITDKEWDLILDVNLSGAFRTVRAAARVLAPGGSIVLVSSVDARMAVAGLAHYCAAKAGLESLVRTAALELAADEICCNSVAPGAVRTPLMAAVLEDPAHAEEFLSRTPLGDIGEPDDIAEVVTFLASDQAAWITGSCLVVDGGLSLREHPSLLRETTVKGQS